MEKLFEVFLQIMRKTAIPFMVAILFLNIAGYGAGGELTKISSLYQTNGISYEAIFQLFALSFCNGVINTIFDHKSFMKKTLLLYKNCLRILLVIAVTISFVCYFKWFAMDNFQAWISFMIVFSICVILSVSISFYLAHKKNKEYQELLIKYKERGSHENNTD